MDESKKQIRISGIIKESITDGPGIRYVVFTQGCPHHCPGCHNPHTFAFDGGTIADCDEIINDMLSNPLTSGLTLSGGEPFVQPATTAYLAKRARENNLNVITYTGYVFEELLKKAQSDPDVKSLIENSDYIIDGPYLEAYRSLELRFRGSKNQRIIDVKKSLLENKVISINENEL